jgi:hypothetical protein
MAPYSDVDDQSNIFSSQPPREETTATKRHQLPSTTTIGTLTLSSLQEPPLPTLSLDLIAEIFCRLPVKLLLQLRCLSKWLNLLITDPKFAKKHLHLSTKRHHLMLTCIDDISSEWLLYDSPIPSIFSTSTIFTQTQLYPLNSITTLSTYGDKSVDVMCSSDGIFCGKLDFSSYSYFLWNPSVRKFKLLPPLENSLGHVFQLSFGYDHFIDNYKVIVVSTKNEVSVYTLGTDYWIRIPDIPYNCHIHQSATFVSGTVNWLASNDSHFIVSLDLVKESYQKLSRVSSI